MRSPSALIKRFFGRARRLYRVHVAKDEVAIEVSRWFADKGDKTLRLDYPFLNQDSVVFDLGGYMGDFAQDIHQKYGCKVYLFEPHPEFYRKCVQRFEGNDKIFPLNFGVSDENGKFTLSDSLDGSSFLNPNHAEGELLECELREFFAVLSDLGVEHIHLMKLNIEGGEFPLLQHIADRDALDTVEAYQIQFHSFIEGADARRDRILSALAKTHKQTWCYKFVWENWTKK